MGKAIGYPGQGRRTGIIEHARQLGLRLPPRLDDPSAGLTPQLMQRERYANRWSEPNIVAFFWDNLGWGEMGCYGGGVLRGAPTPRIDKLADEGLRLLNFNVEAQCTPSRSAILTGRATRFGRARRPCRSLVAPVA